MIKIQNIKIATTIFAMMVACHNPSSQSSNPAQDQTAEDISINPESMPKNAVLNEFFKSKGMTLVYSKEDQEYHRKFLLLVEKISEEIESLPDEQRKKIFEIAGIDEENPNQLGIVGAAFRGATKLAMGALYGYGVYEVTDNAAKGNYYKAAEWVPVVGEGLLVKEFGGTTLGYIQARSRIAEQEKVLEEMQEPRARYGKDNNVVQENTVNLKPLLRNYQKSVDALLEGNFEELEKNGSPSDRGDQIADHLLKNGVNQIDWDQLSLGEAQMIGNIMKNLHDMSPEEFVEWVGEGELPDGFVARQNAQAESISDADVNDLLARADRMLAELGDGSQGDVGTCSIEPQYSMEVCHLKDGHTEPTGDMDADAKNPNLHSYDPGEPYCDVTQVAGDNEGKSERLAVSCFEIYRKIVPLPDGIECDDFIYWSP